MKPNPYEVTKLKTEMEMAASKFEAAIAEWNEHIVVELQEFIDFLRDNHITNNVYEKALEAQKLLCP